MASVAADNAITAAAVDHENSAEESSTATTQQSAADNPVPSLLARAESLWKSQDIAGAIREYDAALAIVTCAGGPHASEAMEGQILLGKGYAILNATTSSPEMRESAIRCLERARDIASASNRPQAVAFVQQLLDRGGKIHEKTHGTSCEHHHGHGEGCAHGAEVEPCTDHDDIGKRVAAAASAREEGSTSLWTSSADEALVALVASQGPRDWESMLEPILAAMATPAAESAENEEETQESAVKMVADPAAVSLTISDISSRWEYLRPLLREEFATGGGMDKERKCGHTCGTCPTRKTCHLHGAIDDIEDMGKVATVVVETSTESRPSSAATKIQ